MKNQDIVEKTISAISFSSDSADQGQLNIGNVITVTSGKGGVGKTTVTANIAVGLASMGNKVVCIDADIGLRNLDVVMGLENRIVYDLADIIEGRCKPRQAMIRDKRLEELYLIPAPQTRDKSEVTPSDMRKLAAELKQNYDYILIDSPAGIERGFLTALAPADQVIVVVQPNISSVRDAGFIIGLVEAEEKGPVQLIINRVNIDMVKRGDMLAAAEVLELLAVELIGVIPEDVAVLVSTNRGAPIVLDQMSRTGQAFREIAERISGNEVSFLEIETDSGSLGRFGNVSGYEAH